jgi:glycosyltransferase involved in cell wall biosynthesis
MLGRNPGYVTTQGQMLSDFFAANGYQVASVSSKLSRLKRLADISHTIIKGRNETDVVVIEIYGGLSTVLEDVSSLLSRLCGIKTVLWLHGGDLPKFMADYPRWVVRILRRASALITPSEFLARAIKLYGFQAHVIPNVVDLQAYPFRPRRQLSPRLFWMRSFHPVWNPLMALRVLEILRRTVPNATLVMAGVDKGYEKETQQIAKEMKLQDAVRFAGFLGQQEKQREATEADIFINTNHIDNMPVSIIEACAFGLPVVTTDVGGIPDLLTEGETGLLVPDDDAKAMADAILRLLNDCNLAERLSTNGRKLAERSSWKEVRPQWEQVFSEILREGSTLGANKITEATMIHR